MKKIITILVVIGMLSLQGCEGPEGPPGRDGFDGLMPKAFDIKNQDLFRVDDNFYSVSNTFKDEVVGSDLYGTDTILVYRLSDKSNPNLPVWQLIPRTIYFSNDDELDYDFNFTSKGYTIIANGNYNLLNRPEYIKKQTFRVVIVPNDLLSSFNKNNYNEVMKVLNMKENQIQKINF